MRFTLVLIVAVFLVSCRKDEDTQAPVIEISSPVDGTQFDVGDTIRIVMDVADDVALSDVEIKITDLNLTPVMPTVMLNASGEGGTLRVEYFLDDLSLRSGQYYIHATVHDAARNDDKDFVLVNITEVPLALKGIIAVTTLPGFVTLHSIDTAWTAYSLGTYPGDFTDMAVNSYWQQVVMTGAVTGMARCISLDGQTPGWTINPFPASGAYWGNVLAHDRDWLINYRTDGAIKTLTWNNMISAQYNANGSYFFRHFVFSGTRLFADMVDATGTSRLLGVYQGGGGATQQAALSVDPVALLPRDDNSIYIAGNQSGQGKLLIYDYGNNGTWEPVALPSGKILSATQIDANTLLIAMDNSNIYKFTYVPVGVLVWNAVAAQHVRYDPAEETVITAEGASIRQYDYQQATLIDQIPFADSVRDVELWYNR
jgi:hypothetical protein